MTTDRRKIRELLVDLNDALLGQDKETSLLLIEKLRDSSLSDREQTRLRAVRNEVFREDFLGAQISLRQMTDPYKRT